jgi:MYXO-CTERM domain-containing protein
LGLKSKPVVYVAYPLATGNNPCCQIRGNIIYDEQIPLIKQVAMERKLPIIDLNTGTMNHPEYFGDGVHPNDAGYLVMAQLVKTGLEREPIVSVNTPVMGAMLPAGMVSITAAASAEAVDISSVEFFDGPTSLGKVMMAPWTFNWQAAVGAHELTVKAVDATLADKTSEPVTVTITDAAGGAGGGGAGGMSSAGTPSGGMASAGSPAAGTGGAPTSSAGSSSGGATSNPTAPATEDAGCGCAVPAGRSGGAALAALVLGTLLLRRRRSAGTPCG